MIRALLDGKGGHRTVILGLDLANLDRLHDGQPIRVNLRRLDPDGAPTDLPDIDVVIAYDDGDLQGWLEDQSRRRL